MTEQTVESKDAPDGPPATGTPAPEPADTASPAAEPADTQPPVAEPAVGEPAVAEPPVAEQPVVRAADADADVSAAAEGAGTHPAPLPPQVPAPPAHTPSAVPAEGFAPPAGYTLQAGDTREPEPQPRKPRRVLRAVARWTVAVLVLGGLGAGTAAGITSMERTDVPGLATKDDGRWDYPELSLPALPAGAPRPFDEGNTAEVHHADLRRLLLPAPSGATVDKRLNGGWVTTAQFASEYGKEKGAEITQQLDDSALRHIAARAWTMPDGTSSRIYLLRFNSTAFATAFQDRTLEDDALVPFASGGGVDLDEDWRSEAGAEYTTTNVYTEPKPYGAEQLRHAYVFAGDTVALVLHSRKGKARTETVPFHQTLILQNQLLG